MRRPTAWLVGVAALLLLAATPVLTLQTGTSGVSTLPADLASRQGFEALERSFGTGSNEPVLAVAVGQGATDVGTALVQEVRRLPGFGEPQVERSGDGQAALLTAPVAGDPNSEAAADAVRALRNSDAANPPAGDVFVTGESAEQVDYSELIAFWLPLVIGFVLLCTLLLLTAVFRSLVVALTAIGLNLLSVGAAYGLLVLVFQHGVAAGLFGFTQVDAVEAWVPLFLFSVLFGLSMDYHVFIVSRIREAHLATGSTDEAVAHGVASTARLITGAALIIIVVFVGFATGDLVMFQQMGFGVAVALLIDATLVRTVLLPAAMTLLGERNWWLPSWLGWLPEVQVEGPAASEEPAS